MKSIAEWCKEIHQVAVEHGWWSTDREFPEIAALIHSEVSEALEDYRLGLTYSRYSPSGKPVGMDFELADIVIRVMDYCGADGIDLEACIEIKHEYNKGRSHRHGSKQA